MFVKLHLAGEEVEGGGNRVASASIVAKHLAYKLKIGTRARKVKVTQETGSFLGGNFVVNTLFKLVDCFFVLSKFAMEAEVLDNGNRDLIFSVF